MLYLIGVWESRNEEHTIYSLFETNSESKIIGNKKLITEILRGHKMQAMNFSINKGKIELKQWPNGSSILSAHGQSSKMYYILLTNIDEQKFKLVNLLGSITYCSTAELKSLIDRRRVMNCCVMIDQGITCYKSEDTYSINEDASFKKHIGIKYEEFRAKILLLGISTDFKYEIENKNVVLTEYTGRSKRVIIPGFITIISNNAFAHKGITDLRLSEGLKYIGEEAFLRNKIPEVIIPRSVKFIGDRAFFGNEGRLSPRIYDTHAIKLLNNKTLVIDNRN